MPCVLCIDDDPNAPLLFGTLLEREGFDVVDAVSTQDALSILRNQQIDLILDRYNRLWHAEFDLLIEKQSDPALYHIPVMVIVSSIAPGPIDDEMAAYGLDMHEDLQGILRTPFLPDDLVALAIYLTS